MTSMRNFIAALAVSLPLLAGAQAAAPAPAPKPLATIYGTLNVNLQNDSAYGAPGRFKERQTVSVDSTNIGVRGTADVAYGMAVTYQCETSAQIDGISVFGICNRNSRIGLTGNWGTLFYGNWDTAYKAAAYGTKADDPFGNTDVFGYENIFSSPGFNTKTGGWISTTPTAVGDAIRSFEVRVNNSVAYWTPKVAGLSAKVSHGVNEFANAADTTTPYLWSAVVNYDMGPASVYAAWERHDDAFGLVGINGGTVRAFSATAANTFAHNEVDQAWKVGAGYELALPAAVLRVTAAVEQLMYEQKHAGAGELKKFDRFAYQAGATLRMGDNELRARYNLGDSGSCTVVGGPCSTSGFGAQNYTIGYARHLSKAAQVYLFYTRIENDRNAQYTFATAGPNFSTTVARGTDPDAYGLGIRYAF